MIRESYVDYDEYKNDAANSEIKSGPLMYAETLKKILNEIMVYNGFIY